MPVKSVLILSALLFPIDLVFADEKESLDGKSGFERTLLEQDIKLSKSIDSIADSIDVFLAGKRYTKTKNPTSVRIISNNYSLEGEGLSNEVDLGVNLRLPNVERSWVLRFTTYDENEEERGVRRNTLRTEPRQKNYGTSLVFLRQLGKVRTTFRPRIQLEDPLYISHVLRFESSAKSADYRLRPRLELFATPSKGTGVFLSLNFNILSTETEMLTIINEFEYQDGENMFTADQGFSYTQPLSDRKVLTYSLIFDSNSRPAYHLAQYVFAVSWSQLVYREILDFQLTPHWDFAETREFKGHAGLNLRMTLTF